jgi:hypothetical protein
LDELKMAAAAGERVLVGLDFPYGYPAGFAAALGLHGEPWKAIWGYLASRIQDDAKNQSNRFEVASAINARLGHNAPFWGRLSQAGPTSLALPHLPTKKPVTYRGVSGPGGLSEWRQVEDCLRGLHTAPQPVWKLFYPGSVGSQSLVGIPVLERLRNHDELRPISRVWPFEIATPDLADGVPAVIHAEIWPSIVPFGHEAGSCRDEQQVRAVVKCWRALDRQGRLAEWFAIPEDTRVRREEGWVLGVPSALPPSGADRPKVRATKKRQRPSNPRTSPVEPLAGTRDRPPCVCGCGDYPRGKSSRFMPGHDQRRDPATGRPFNAH